MTNDMTIRIDGMTLSEYMGQLENQLTQSQARIQEFEALVREMGDIMAKARKMMPKSRQYAELWCDLDEQFVHLLNNPEVQAIMEKKP